MSRDARRAAEVRAILRESFAAAGGSGVVPAELAAGVVHHLGTLSPWQAQVVAACWWPGWTPETLADLLAVGRADAIAAHFREPTGRRVGVAEAARALGSTEPNVAQALDRGTEALAAWLVARARATTGGGES